MNAVTSDRGFSFGIDARNNGFSLMPALVGWISNALAIEWYRWCWVSFRAVCEERTSAEP